MSAVDRPYRDQIDPAEAVDRLLSVAASRQPAALRRCTDAQLAAILNELDTRPRKGRAQSAIDAVLAEQEHRASSAAAEAFAQRKRDHTAALHHSGVQTECQPARRKVPSGRGTPAACRYAGAVERWHSHDFDGPLWAACGCPEYAN